MPRLQLQQEFQSIHRGDPSDQRSRDNLRNLGTNWTRRQDSSSESEPPAPDDSESMPDPSIIPPPSSSATASPSPLSYPILSTTSSNASQQLPSSTHSSTPSNAEQNTDAKPIIFGVIGGLFGFVLLGFIVFRLIRRHQHDYRRRMAYESFWEKWHWGTYSPVDGGVPFGSQNASATDHKGAKGDEEQGRMPSAWWQKFTFAAAPAANGRDPQATKQTKKTRARTMYKVKRLKPGEKIDIDSCPLESDGPPSR